MKTVKLSKMEIGDYGTRMGDILQLRDGGKSGGCETDRYLVFVCTVGDEYDGRRGNPSSDTLPEIDVDTDDISA